VITLITGADGYVGRSVARQILATSDDRILALMRAKDADELERKRRFLEAELGAPGARLDCRALNLPSADGFVGLEREQVRHIVHSAAVTEFNVARPVAEAVNVEGTRATIGFARSCPRLERFVLISTIYSSGLRAGEIGERYHDDTCGFANHYEWSKWAAESLLEEASAELPWQIHRLATVLADDESGRVVQFNVVHKMWRLLHSGLLPLLPGSPETALYFVTGQFAARAIPQLMREAGPGTTFHLCNSGDEALSAKQLLELACAAFGKDPTFARRRVLRPLFADEAAFNRLADTAAMFSREALGTVIGLMRPFAKQLFVPKSLRTDVTSSIVDAFRPNWAALVENTCDHLLTSGFGLGR
jgi:nucleoside-diphosphate-sugar epimerase